MNREFKTYELELINGEIALINDNDEFKAFKSTDYNFLFDKKTGFFVRWGKANSTELKRKITQQELKIYFQWCIIWNTKFKLKEFVCDLDTDGSLDTTAVEILDWEISDCCSMGCGFCYKSNIIKGNNLDFESFKHTFNKLPISITTIAYGIGDIALQPYLWDILAYTRNNGIIPTITINGNATDDDLDNLVKYVGACAVSIYDKDKSYNCVKGLTDRGLKQCNIHYMLSEETYLGAFDIINDFKTDSRLEKLNALVFLSLKEKGRSKGKYNTLSQDKFDKLFEYAIESGIGIGFDSCSSGKAFNFIDKNPQYDYMRQYIDPCEIGIGSAYLNVGKIDENGLRQPEYFPCSFTEGTEGWETGIKINDDFMKDIWFDKRTLKSKEGIKKCRSCNIGCSIYNI